MKLTKNLILSLSLLCLCSPGNSFAARKQLEGARAANTEVPTETQPGACYLVVTVDGKVQLNFNGGAGTSQSSNYVANSLEFFTPGCAARHEGIEDAAAAAGFDEKLMNEATSASNCTTPDRLAVTTSQNNLPAVADVLSALSRYEISNPIGRAALIFNQSITTFLTLDECLTAIGRSGKTSGNTLAPAITP